MIIFLGFNYDGDTDLIDDDDLISEQVASGLMKWQKDLPTS